MLGDPGGTQPVMGCGATWSDVAATLSSEAKKSEVIDGKDSYN